MAKEFLITLLNRYRLQGTQDSLIVPGFPRTWLSAKPQDIEYIVTLTLYANNGFHFR